MTINIREKAAAIDLGLGLDLATRIGNAVDQVFHHHENEIRWIPHPKMPSDPMTKADVAKSNDALTHLLKSGTISLIDEEAEMLHRKNGNREKGRSKTASKRALLED